MYSIYNKTEKKYVSTELAGQRDWPKIGGCHFCIDDAAVFEKKPRELKKELTQRFIGHSFVIRFNRMSSPVCVVVDI